MGRIHLQLAYDILTILLNYVHHILEHLRHISLPHTVIFTMFLHERDTLFCQSYAYCNYVGSEKTLFSLDNEAIFCQEDRIKPW